MLKASQKRTKRARLLRGVDVEHAGQVLRLVADDADRVAVEAREADDDVLREVLVDLEELAVVDDQRDDVAHVVGLLRVVRDDRVERLVHRARGRRRARPAAASRGCSSGRNDIR